MAGGSPERRTRAGPTPIPALTAMPGERAVLRRRIDARPAEVDLARDRRRARALVPPPPPRDLRRAAPSSRRRRRAARGGSGRRRRPRRARRPSAASAAPVCRASWRARAMKRTASDFVCSRRRTPSWASAIARRSRAPPTRPAADSSAASSARRRSVAAARAIPRRRARLASDASTGRGIVGPGPRGELALRDAAMAEAREEGRAGARPARAARRSASAGPPSSHAVQSGCRAALDGQRPPAPPWAPRSRRRRGRRSGGSRGPRDRPGPARAAAATGSRASPPTRRWPGCA